MAIGLDVTEIADSEAEPLTSSPAAVADADVDKLSATVGQDAQAVACSHEDAARHTANEAMDCTDVLDVYQKKRSTDIGSTHMDRSDLHSTNETATNHASARAVEAQFQADDCVAGAHQQETRTVTDRSDADAAGPSEEGNSLEAMRVSWLTGRAISQMDQHIRPSEPQHDHAQAQQDYTSNTSDVDSVKQCGSSNHRLHDEAVDNSTTVLTSPQFDSLRPSSKQELPQAGDASAPFQQDLVASEHNNPAAIPSLDITHEATINLPSSPSTNCSEAIVAVSQTVSDDAVQLDAPPEVSDIESSGVTPGQRKTAVESPALRDTPISATYEEPQIASETAAISSNPATDAGCATTRDECKASDKSSFVVGSKPQREMSDSRNLPNSRCAHDHMDTNLTNDCSRGEPVLSIDSAMVSIGQGLEKDHQLRETAEEAAAKSTSGEEAQNASDTIQSRDDQSMADGQAILFKGFEAKTESQSTVSQTSEPTSPYPAPQLSPQEITLAELRAQKTALLSSLRVQPAIQVIMEENQASDVNMSDDDGEPTEAELMTAANKIVKEHIRLLHEYNELKDVGQGLMGLIAESRGLRIVEIQDEFGIDAKD